MYIREISSVIQRLATFYPVVEITGPRQAGKTTLAKLLFPNLPYVSLENLDTRAEAKKDPRGFLQLYKDGAIFDEVQNFPDLLSYLQGVVDDDQRKGRFIITGSQNFVISSQISQSLAGRVGTVTLLPLSLYELQQSSSVYESIFNGSYPRLHQLKIPPTDFYPAYIQRYVERDLRQLKNIGDLTQFQTFLKLCAGRAGQLLNISSLAQDTGISHTTARAWLSILEASYITFTLSPHYRNFSKRLIKMPKLYFYDTGLACSLLGMVNAGQVEAYYLKGALFENLMVLEVMKGRLNRGQVPNLYFWRDRTGHEIDLIGDWEGSLRAIEIKLGSTFQETYIRDLKYFMELCGQQQPSQAVTGYLVSTSVQPGNFRDVTFVPMNAVHDKICLS